MRLFKFGLPALALLASVSTASAAVYKCNMTTLPKSGGIGETMFFELTDNNTKALVLDGMINELHGRPLVASIQKRKENVYRIRWEVKRVPSTNESSLNLKYSARFDIGTGKLIVNGLIASYNQEINGRGKCALQN